MAVEELSEITGENQKKLISDSFTSKTGKLLYDESSKLWWNGPSYLFYIAKNGGIAQVSAVNSKNFDYLKSLCYADDN